MIVGHYAVGFAAKRWAPRTSLGTLFAAAALLDLIWPVLVLAGIEVVAIMPGATVVNPLTFISYPWSHSLVMSIAWAIAFGTGYLITQRYMRGAITVAVLVVSHWFLDFVVHGPDLPLVPGTSPRFGLGLWNSLPASLAVELGLFAVGLWIYARATKPRDPAGLWGLVGMVLLLLLIFAGAMFGPPPRSAEIVAVTDLGQWLIVAFAAWVDGHRRPI
jgi:hypothetical protein